MLRKLLFLANKRLTHAMLLLLAAAFALASANDGGAAQCPRGFEPRAIAHVNGQPLIAKADDLAGVASIDIESQCGSQLAVLPQTACTVPQLCTPNQACPGGGAGVGACGAPGGRADG